MKTRNFLVPEQEIVIGSQIFGVLVEDTLAFYLIDPEGQRSDDRLDDLGLDGKQFFGVPLISLGPQVTPARGVNQLGVDADFVPRPLHAALEDVADAEVFGHLLYLHRLALVSECRVTRDHEEPTELR